MSRVQAREIAVLCEEKMKVLQTENDQHQATIRRVFSVVEP